MSEFRLREADEELVELSKYFFEDDWNLRLADKMPPSGIWYCWRVSAFSYGEIGRNSVSTASGTTVKSFRGTFSSRFTSLAV